MFVLIFLSRIFSIPAILIKNFLRHKNGPERLRSVLEELGGVYIKLGQILAMRFDILPIDYASGLLDLLDSAAPVENEKMFAVFEKETGKKIKEVFNELDEAPVGTASFAQVYRGQWGDEAVAIKIQKPDVQKYVKADLFFLKFVFSIAEFLGILRSVSMKEVGAQLEEWLEDELDYTIEAGNNRILYDHAQRHKLENTVIPKAYEQLTTKKILVQEFIFGSQVKKIMVYLETRPQELKKILDERKIDLFKASNAFVYDLMRQYFIDGFFHADPHPANLMIFPESRIGFIDFGIIGRSKYDSTGLLRFIQGAVELDFRQSAEGIVEFLNERLMRDYGEVMEGDHKTQKTYETVLEFITRRLTEDMAPIIKDWNFFTGRKDANIAERSSARAFLRIAKTIEKYGLKFPSDVIAFLRSLVIIDMVCLRLDNNFNMVQAAKIFFEHNTPEDIRNKAPEHQEETAQLNTLESLSLSGDTPEKEGETSTRIEEKHYAARERLINTITALAEKYPELYNEIKDL